MLARGIKNFSGLFRWQTFLCRSVQTCLCALDCIPKSCAARLSGGKFATSPAAADIYEVSRTGAVTMKNRYSRRQFLERSTVAGALLLAPGRLLAQSTPAKRSAADQVTLGKTGIKLSRLGFGTGSNSGHVQFDLGQDAFNDLIHYAYDQGITYFDCAQAYKTFPWIGAAIKGLPREKLFIQSKIDGRPEDILAAIDRHRKVFDTDYVDSMLVHCMVRNHWTDDWKRIMDGFDEAKDKKWIRAKGVSCHSLPALRGARQSDWTEVHLVRVNPQGAFMDGEKEDYNMI